MPYLVIHLIEPIYLLKQKTKLKENPKQTKTTTKTKQYITRMLDGQQINYDFLVKKKSINFTF